MLYRTVIGGVALAATLSIGDVSAQTRDLSKYPDWSGAWARFVVRGVGGRRRKRQHKGNHQRCEGAGHGRVLFGFVSLIGHHRSSPAT